jgi:hypothetical protein
VVEIKTAAEVQAMRAAGQVVAQILAAVRTEAKAGTRTADLDEAARGVLAEAGATSPFLGYRPAFAPVPFPATICTSVNDAAVLISTIGYAASASGRAPISGTSSSGWAGKAAVLAIQAIFARGEGSQPRVPRDLVHPAARPHRRASPEISSMRRISRATPIRRATAASVAKSPSIRSSLVTL